MKNMKLVFVGQFSQETIVLSDNEFKFESPYTLVLKNLNIEGGPYCII